nr:MAG TPA: hypothetical protein [Caudoviricetes sp.]
MSEVKKTADPNEELVEYTAPLMGHGDSRDVVVGVNGEFIRIMRGETVKIKRKFLLVLQNAEKQEMDAYKAQMAAQKSSAKALADM